MWPRLLQVQRTSTLYRTASALGTTGCSLCRPASFRSSMSSPAGRASRVDRACSPVPIQLCHRREVHVFAPRKHPRSLHKAWQLPRREKSSISRVAAPSASAAAIPATCTSSPTHFSQLFLKDFALVQEQTVKLLPGFTVITGESGSGKSVLVEALGQLLGATAYDEAVRPPAESAVLEAVVQVAAAEQGVLRRLLAQLGVPERASRVLHTLTLRRELVRGLDGGIRSRCFLNGSPTSVRVLREVGTLLVDVNGQHAALSLRDGATRLRLLDRLAGTSAAAARLNGALATWQQAQAQLRELDALSDEEQRQAMQQLVDDVRQARIEPGEERALRCQLRQLDGRRAAAHACRLISVGLGGDGGGGMADAMRDVQLQVKQLLSQEERLAAQAAAELAAEGAERQPVGYGAASAAAAAGEEVDGDEDSAQALLLSSLALLDQAQLLLDEAEEKVMQYGQLYRFSQHEYDELSERLQQLERLSKQHDASSADQLLEIAEKQEAALDSYFALEGQREQLELEAEQLLQAVHSQALALSQARRQAAVRLRAAVEAVLADLAMAGARFDVRMHWTPLSAAAASSASSSLAIDAADAAGCCEREGAYRVRPGGAGLDSAEFLFAAGPAEPLRALSVASGGESARIMLALKAAPAFMLAADEGEGSAAAGRTSVDSGSTSDHSSSSSSSKEEEASSVAGAGQILVLDEVDSGIGSRLGQPIGRILRRMAGTTGCKAGQILVVSHLPQVAAHAEHHLVVRKAVGAGKRSVTQFNTLHQRPERLAEISSMLGLPQAAAEEILQAAAQP